jgi:hypothetical protein
MQSNRKGYRGYVFSRSVDNHRVPQHIQNLVIRDYAARRKLHYLLSATEYAMPGCYLILDRFWMSWHARRCDPLQHVHAAAEADDEPGYTGGCSRLAAGSTRQ